MSAFVAQQRHQQENLFCKSVLGMYGTLGLVIYYRSRTQGFDRRTLCGPQRSTMGTFSAGMNIQEISR